MGARSRIAGEISMDMSMFTSLDGRLNRQKWWIGVIVLAIAEYVVFFVVAMLFGSAVEADPAAAGVSANYNLGVVGGLIAFVALLPLIWASLCLSAKRWHDRGKSAWWILIGLVPIVGGIWTLVECGFLKGTDGANQFGPDPLAG
jgi:uncharacterized membrane protein YhaH (DUF805 family)